MTLHVRVLAVVLVAIVAVPLFLYFFPPRTVGRSLKAFERRTGTPPTCSAAVVVVATGTFLAVTLVVDDVGIVEGLGAATGVFGPLFAALALGSRPPLRRFAAATDRPTGAPGQADGVVAVEGAAQVVTDPIATPVGEAVSCAYVLQRGRASHRSTAWHTVAEGERTVPFTVDDGSGPVRVDTERLCVRTASPTNTFARTVDLPANEEVPEDVAAFLAREEVEFPVRPEDDHRLKLRLFEPGGTVSVVGRYDRVVTEVETFWGITGGESRSGPLRSILTGAREAYLFTGDRETVRARLRRTVRLLGPLGVGLTLVCVAYVATLYGVL